MIGEPVYLISDRDNEMNIVTGYLIESGALIRYRIANKEGVSFHVEVELSRTKNYSNV